jgi:hypothetical protein
VDFSNTIKEIASIRIFNVPKILGRIHVEKSFILELQQILQFTKLDQKPRFSHFFLMCSSFFERKAEPEQPLWLRSALATGWALIK